ncbi:MAG: RNA polymerase sigma-70 factor [Ponticaulis sp.]|nr:RNA polymerase sigma-70 factor [Ponticaulis sp.]|tara:strand:- start:3246 stop:3830 length:585 start_codon:yes stop_codon:yes gene_type:complete
MAPDDDVLLRRCAEGDRQASALLINRYSKVILAIAQRMTGSREDAEDITQEVFIKIFRQAGKWEAGKAKFSTWIHRVTVNQCYDRLRKKRETGVSEVPDMMDDTAGPASQLQSQQASKRVRAAMAELPERQRAALLLSHFEGLSNIEAAEILEISVEAVESLLSRARRGLRNALKGERADLMGHKDELDETGSV